MAGTTRQRGPRKYELRYMVGGKLHTKTVPASGKREADRLLRKFTTAIDAGRNAVDPERRTVGRWLTEWLGQIKPDVAARTHQGYEGRIRTRIVPELGDLQLTRLAPSDLETFRAKLASSGLSRGSIRNINITLGAALDDAVAEKLIGINPAKVSTKKRRGRAHVEPTREMQILDEAQTRALLAASLATDLYPSVLLAIATGARAGEVLALRWKDVDLVSGAVRISESLAQIDRTPLRKSTKTGKARVVVIGQAAIEALRRLKRDQAERLLGLGHRQTTNDSITLRRDGRTLTPWLLSETFRRFVRSIQLPAGTDGEVAPIVRFHDLRHGHASHLLRAGANLVAVSKRLGHSDPSITLRVYSHCLPSDQDAAARLADVMFANL
jgi:integrase